MGSNLGVPSGNLRLPLEGLPKCIHQMATQPYYCANYYQ